MAGRQRDPDDQTIDDTRWPCPAVGASIIALVIAVIAVACYFLFLRR